MVSGISCRAPRTQLTMAHSISGTNTSAGTQSMTKSLVWLFFFPSVKKPCGFSGVGVSFMTCLRRCGCYGRAMKPLAGVITRSFGGQFLEDREVLEGVARELGMRFKVVVKKGWCRFWSKKVFVVEGSEEQMAEFELRTEFLLLDLLA